LTVIHPLLEVCVDDPAGLAAAVDAGADRIELCSALALSGLTPSRGLMQLAAQQSRPSYAMIRPRAGDFRYAALDIDVMRKDIDAARDAGLAGVVLGANHRSGQLDEEGLRTLVDHAAGLGVTLHRAFDLVPNFEAALECAIALGFERVLTSGGARTATAGAERIADLVVQARGRIAIMAGAGLTANNVADLVGRTRVTEVHASCSTPVPELADEADTGERAKSLGFHPVVLRRADAQAVAAMAHVCRRGV
jgi:copper homeostasis protein